MAQAHLLPPPPPLSGDVWHKLTFFQQFLWEVDELECQWSSLVASRPTLKHTAIDWDKVRAVSRSTPPRRGSTRFRLAPSTYTPWCVRVEGLRNQLQDETPPNYEKHYRPSINLMMINLDIFFGEQSITAEDLKEVAAFAGLGPTEPFLPTLEPGLDGAGIARAPRLRLRLGAVSTVHPAPTRRGRAAVRPRCSAVASLSLPALHVCLRVRVAATCTGPLRDDALEQHTRGAAATGQAEHINAHVKAAGHEGSVWRARAEGGSEPLLHASCRGTWKKDTMANHHCTTSYTMSNHYCNH